MPIPPTPVEDTYSKRIRLRTYAWSYFAFHAEQRMKTFHFYLLLIAAMAAALITLQSKPQKEVTTEIILYFGVAFISFMFYLLDRRNRELVRNGENALRYLDELEGHERSNNVPHALELFARDGYFTSEKPSVPSLHAHYSYTKILGTIFLGFGLIGAIVGTLRLITLCGS